MSNGSNKSSLKMPKQKLNDGNYMPVIGLGTWMGTTGDFTDDMVTQCVELAIDEGYRHIDTAWMYRTEKAIGQAIKNKITSGDVKRHDLFIATKLWMTHHAPSDVRENFNESLSDLGLEYIDLYLIHQPFGLQKPDGPYNPLTYTQEIPLDNNSDIVQTWKVLEELVKEGKIKSIGVSNFNAAQVQTVLDNCKIKPVTNQCEIHINLQNTDLVKYCQDRGIIMTAYSPLGQPPAAIAPSGWSAPLESSVIAELAKKYKKSPAQVALRYQNQRGIVIVTKTMNRDRMKDNFNILNFQLDKGDMKRISELDKGLRIFTWPQGNGHKDYPF